MALLWIEGFETYGTNTASAVDSLLSQRYGANLSSGYYLVAGRYGGYALTNTCGTARAACLLTPPLTTNPTLAVGAAIKWTGSVSTYSPFQLYDGATLGIDVQTTSGGEIAVYRNTTLLGTTSGSGLTSGTWFYVEVQIYCHASAGTVTVIVNGVTKLTLTAKNTQQGTDAFYDRVRIGPSGTSYMYFDDVYILDGSGSLNNAPLGVHKVIGVVPAADVSTQWTPSAGTSHYALVDENPSDGDTTYVQCGTTGQMDLYTYSGVPPVGTIIGIQINTTCKESADTVHKLITPVVSGDTESDDTSQVIGANSYVDRRRIVQTDPATGVGWTLAGLNAAQIGVKVG